MILLIGDLWSWFYTCTHLLVSSVSVGFSHLVICSMRPLNWASPLFRPRTQGSTINRLLIMHRSASSKQGSSVVMRYCYPQCNASLFLSAFILVCDAKSPTLPVSARWGLSCTWPIRDPLWSSRLLWTETLETGTSE